MDDITGYRIDLPFITCFFAWWLVNDSEKTYIHRFCAKLRHKQNAYVGKSLLFSRDPQIWFKNIRRLSVLSMYFECSIL